MRTVCTAFHHQLLPQLQRLARPVCGRFRSHSICCGKLRAAGHGDCIDIKTTHVFVVEPAFLVAASLACCLRLADNTSAKCAGPREAEMPGTVGKRDTCYEQRRELPFR